MNMINRTAKITMSVPKRGATYRSEFANGIHINRVSLPAEPWSEPELEPEHQRPAPEAVYKLSSPKIDIQQEPKFRIDRFTMWDEEELRRKWIDSIPPEQRNFSARPCNAEPKGYYDIGQLTLDKISRHLKAKEDSINGICQGVRLSTTAVKRALSNLRDNGKVASRYASGPNPHKIYSWIGEE